MSLIVCYIHRLDLAVSDILVENNDTLDVDCRIMRKLRQLNPSAKLRPFSELKAKVNNATRWSSSLQMLERYPLLGDVLSDVANE